MRWCACALLGLLLLGCASPVPQSHQATPDITTPQQRQTPPQRLETPPTPQPRVVHAFVVDPPARPPLLSALQFVDATHGWAAAAGTILATVDGGRTWQSQYTGTAMFGRLFFTDPQHGWAEAPDTLLRTEDGGQHWTYKTLPPVQLLPGHMATMALATNLLGWAVGAGELYRTADAGDTWTKLATPTAFESICFAGPHAGWAASGRQIWHTANGGASWQESLLAPSTVEAETVSLGCAGDTAWALFVGQGAMGRAPYAAFSTRDGGQHWHPRLSSQHLPGGADPVLGLPELGPSPGPLAIPDDGAAFFLGHCSACGDGTVRLARTFDGGKSWQHTRIEGVNAEQAVSFPDRRHGWLLGRAGGTVILATQDGGETWAPQYPSARTMPNGAVEFVTADLGYGLGQMGQDGAILRTDDGGQTWRQIATLPGHAAYWVDYALANARLGFADRQHGWAIAPDNRLYRTADGGLTWRPVPLAAKGVPVSVHLVAIGQGCVALRIPEQQEPVLLQTVDDGRTWQPGPAAGGVTACASRLVEQAWRAAPPAGAGPDWQAMTTRSERDGWAIATYGQLIATGDGGQTWTRYSMDALAGTGLPFLSVSFLDRTLGWGLTRGLLLQTRDGGQTWHTP